MKMARHDSFIPLCRLESYGMIVLLLVRCPDAAEVYGERQFVLFVDRES